MREKERPGKARSTSMGAREPTSGGDVAGGVATAGAVRVAVGVAVGLEVGGVEEGKVGVGAKVGVGTSSAVAVGLGLRGVRVGVAVGTDVGKGTAVGVERAVGVDAGGVSSLAQAPSTTARARSRDARSLLTVGVSRSVAYRRWRSIACLGQGCLHLGRLVAHDDLVADDR